MIHRILVVAVGALLATACGEAPTDPSNVIGDTWRLVSLQRGSEAPVPVGNPERYTLRFGDGGRLQVRSDCNSCGGSYTLAGSSLEVGPIVCTRAFCGEASLDSSFVAALQAATVVTERDNELIVEGGGATLRFEK